MVETLRLAVKELESPKPIETSQELNELIGGYKICINCFDINIKGKHIVCHHIPLGGFPTSDTPPGPALPAVRFAFYGEDKLIGLDEPLHGALAEILRDEKGRVEYFRVGSRAHKKLS